MVNQQTGEVCFLRFGFLDSARFAFDFSVILILMSLHPLIFLKESFFSKKVLYPFGYSKERPFLQFNGHLWTIALKTI